jgi:hypothetical protein
MTLNIFNKNRSKIYSLLLVILIISKIDLSCQALIESAINNFYLCQPSAISFSPDNNYLAISNLGGNFLSIFSFNNGENGEISLIKNFYSQYFSKLSSVSFTPDSNQTNGYYIVISDFFENNYNAQLLLFKFDDTTNDLLFQSYTNGSTTRLDPLSLAFSEEVDTKGNYFIAVSYVGNGIIDLFKYNSKNKTIELISNTGILPIASGASVSFTPIDTGNNFITILATNYYGQAVNSYTINLTDIHNLTLQSSYINNIYDNETNQPVNPIGVTCDNNNNIFVSYYNPNTNQYSINYYQGSYNNNNYILTYQNNFSTFNNSLYNPFALQTNQGYLYIANLTPIPSNPNNQFGLYFNIYNYNYNETNSNLNNIYSSPGIFGTNKLASININGDKYIYVSNIAKYLLLEAPSLDAFSIFKYTNNNITYLATVLDANLRTPSAIAVASTINGNYLFIANLGFNYKFGNGYFFVPYIINPDGSTSQPGSVQYIIDNSLNNEYINNPISLAISNDNQNLFIGNQGNPGQPFISVYNIEQCLSGTNQLQVYVYNPENIYILNTPSSMFTLSNENILVVVNENGNFISAFNYSGNILDGTFSIEYNPNYSNLFSNFISYCPYINSITTYLDKYFLATNLNNSLTFSSIYNQTTCFLNNYSNLSNLMSPNNSLFLNQLQDGSLNFVVSNMNNNLVLYKIDQQTNCSITNVPSGNEKIYIDQYNILPSNGNYYTNTSFKPSIGQIIGYGPKYNNNILYLPESNNFSGQVSLEYSFDYNNNTIEYSTNGLYFINIDPIALNQNLIIDENSILSIDLNNITKGNNLNVSYTQPAHGFVYFNNINNILIYYPYINFTGNDQFIYTIESSDGILSSSGIINLTVSPIIPSGILSKKIKNKYCNNNIL